ncbi:hypothetical protein EC9_29800 [Rosistilla ulvae]|uniref:Uncharacterized protein n=1 Tax=Rosistilla ulvae TaxID=1930277 RepID=A0A517M1M5_9BACT|nr:hypothetical protein EC9_29800 [Rosistilla ulvae]
MRSALPPGLFCEKGAGMPEVRCFATTSGNHLRSLRDRRAPETAADSKEKSRLPKLGKQFFSGGGGARNAKS